MYKTHTHTQTHIFCPWSVQCSVSRGDSTISNISTSVASQQETEAYWFVGNANVWLWLAPLWFTSYTQTHMFMQANTITLYRNGVIYRTNIRHVIVLLPCLHSFSWNKKRDCLHLRPQQRKHQHWPRFRFQRQDGIFAKWIEISVANKRQQEGLKFCFAWSKSKHKYLITTIRRYYIGIGIFLLPNICSISHRNATLVR